MKTNPHKSAKEVYCLPLLDAMQMANLSWKRVSCKTILNGWKHTRIIAALNQQPFSSSTPANHNLATDPELRSVIDETSIVLKKLKWCKGLDESTSEEPKDELERFCDVTRTPIHMTEISDCHSQHHPCSQPTASRDADQPEL
ncbi:hypothetical protein CROQUDRAFT_91279 [Cronartium quercuum f. sp. fusiforme G11]|uniref:Uncharacterized protein n=1 Tax=Cronartium quercuum f. sp. fusiforme G11 TaxID=708437 RepID=A0A9P6NNV7_9BASI|nr:hypothetical protein CROQUDRAFT_91279 [Cronartium quercuum f. sp. fusiforme G11]